MDDIMFSLDDLVSVTQMGCVLLKVTYQWTVSTESKICSLLLLYFNCS